MLWQKCPDSSKPSLAESLGKSALHTKLGIETKMKGSTRPFIFQYSPQPRLQLKITIDGKERLEEGDIFCESTFISD